MEEPTAQDSAQQLRFLIPQEYSQSAGRIRKEGGTLIRSQSPVRSLAQHSFFGGASLAYSLSRREDILRIRGVASAETKASIRVL